MNNIVKPLEETFKSKDAYDLVANAGDIAMDVIIDDGALDGVPIIGAIKGLYKVTKNYQTYWLMKKNHRFIFITHDTHTSKNKCNKDLNFQNKSVFLFHHFRKCRRCQF